MVGQQRLPEELIQDILRQLESSSYTDADENRRRKRTLVSCLSVSRTFYRFTTPVLYHTINTKDLITVAHYFAHNPSLADKVRELAVTANDCLECVQVMEEHESFQWPEYMHSRTSAHPSLLADSSHADDNSTCGYAMPVATLALIVCTKVRTLVLHGVEFAPLVLPETILTECLDLNQAQPGNSYMPLAG
jgi:hypothetical protein